MSEIVMGQLRALLAAFGGYLVAKGNLDQPTAELAMQVAPLVIAMGSSAFDKLTRE